MQHRQGIFLHKHFTASYIYKAVFYFWPSKPLLWYAASAWWRHEACICPQWVSILVQQFVSENLSNIYIYLSFLNWSLTQIINLTMLIFLLAKLHTELTVYYSYLLVICYLPVHLAFRDSDKSINHRLFCRMKAD